MTFDAKKFRLPMVVALAMAIAGSPMCQAQDSTQPTAPSSTAATDTKSAATTTPASVTLSGGVQKVNLSLENLRDVGLDLKHLLRTSSNLYDEVTIQPVRMITEPSYIGHGIVINIPVSTQPIGPAQPPRPERVAMAMNGIRPVVALLKQNVDEFESGKRQLDLPESVRARLDDDFTAWVTTVKELSQNEAALEGLTKGPTFDNQAIANATVAMQKDVKKLEDTRLKIYKVIRKEGKRLSQKDK